MPLQSIAACWPRRKAHRRLGVPCEITLCTRCASLVLQFCSLFSFLFPGSSGTTDIPRRVWFMPRHLAYSFSVCLTRGCGRLQLHCFLSFGNVKVTVPRSPLVRVRCISCFCQATSASRAMTSLVAEETKRVAVLTTTACVFDSSSEYAKPRGVNALLFPFSLDQTSCFFFS